MSERIQNFSKDFHLLIGASIALFLATQTVQPIFPLYVTEKGASTFELGLILSIMSFTAIAAKVPLGILAEHFGKWKVIPIALFGQSLSLILYSIVSDAWWFYPIRIFHALILAAFAPTTIAITSDLAPEGKRGDRIGKYLTSFGAATMFGPFLCSFLSEYLDYTQILRLTAVMPLLGLIAFLLASRKNPHNPQTLHFEEGQQHEERSINPLVSLKEIALSRNVLVLSYLRLTFSFTKAFITTLFALYASKSLLLTSSLIALLFGVKGVTNMLFRFPSGRLSDRVGRKLPLIVSYSLLVLVFLIISESRDFYLLSFAMAIYGLAHAMRAVTEWSLLGDTTSPENSGVATAYLSTMFNVGGAFGAVASGILSLIFPIQSIFKLASLIILPGAFMPFMIRQYVKSNKFNASAH